MAERESIFFAKRGHRGERFPTDIETETETETEVETESDKDTPEMAFRKRAAAIRKRPQPVSVLHTDNNELVLESEDAAKKTITRRWVDVDEEEGGLKFVKRKDGAPNMEVTNTETGKMKWYWLQGVIQNPSFVRRRGKEPPLHVIGETPDKFKVAWREGPLRGKKQFRSAYEGPAAAGAGFEEFRFGAYKFPLDTSRDLRTSECTKHGILQVGPSCMSATVLNAFLVIEPLRNAATAYFAASSDASRHAFSDLKDIVLNAIYKQLCGKFASRRIREVTPAAACVDEVLPVHHMHRGDMEELLVKVASFFDCRVALRRNRRRIAGHTIVGALVFFTIPAINSAHLMLGTICGPRGPVLFDSNMGEFAVDWTVDAKVFEAAVAADELLMRLYGNKILFRVFIHLPNDLIERHKHAVPC